jgi:N-methylhydantoinase A/oxoprolinase/acetone carboxylase beta subunit
LTPSASFTTHYGKRRSNWKGEALEPLGKARVRRQVQRLSEQGIEEIAVRFLHAYVNPAYELGTGEIAAEVFLESYVGISSDISRKWREFERSSTTVFSVYKEPTPPASLGLGGEEPTGTDAPVMLGYLDPNFNLGHRMVLDRTAAEQTIHRQPVSPVA